MTLYTGSLSQQKALALAPKVPALLSLLGSLFIAISVLRERKRLLSTNHRLLLGMSVCDIIVSVWWFLSSWAMPVGTWWQAVGNDATCKTQAFMVQFSMANVFYSGSLGLYYFLVIRQGWNKQRIQKMEPFLHTVPLLMGLVPSFTLMLGLGIYKPYGPLCFMGQPEIGIADNLLPLLVGTVVTVLMFLMFWSVREKEKKMDRYGSSSLQFSARSSESVVSSLRKAIESVKSAVSTSNKVTNSDSTVNNFSRSKMQRKKLRKTKMVALQGIFYCIPFYITWTAALVFTFLHMILSVPVSHELFMLFCIVEPAQGFFNFLIYIRPEIMRYFRDKARKTELQGSERFEVDSTARNTRDMYSTARDTATLGNLSEVEQDEEGAIDMNDADDLNKALPSGGGSEGGEVSINDLELASFFEEC